MEETLFCAEPAERDAAGNPLSYCRGCATEERKRSRKEHKNWRSAKDLARYIVRHCA
jgi:predicted Fe-S protein YdhL (DUF1289 family)